jgi:hypothetical protein
VSVGIGLLALRVRFLRSIGVERLQVAWILYGVAFSVSLLAIFGATYAVAPKLALQVAWVLIPLSIIPAPVCIGVAVLRYRLYDIDLLIKRTVVYGLLTTAGTAVYLVIVVGVGTLIRSRGEANLLLSILATALIAVVFQPARDRSRRLANRLV